MTDINDIWTETTMAKQEGRFSRCYAMLFWFLFGTLGSVIGTAVFVSEMFPLLTSKESFRAIWATAIPLALVTNVFGWFATRNRAVRNWSVLGFVVLFVALRIASYFL